MGLGSDQQDSSTEEAINAQLAQTKAELEQKKQSLFETRFNIIKAQGGQGWTPNVAGYAPKNGNVR